MDPPELKPRQQLENVAAALLYTVSTVNIAVNLLALLTHLTGSHALQEPAMVLCWGCWSTLYLISLIVLILLSYYSLLGNFGGRLALHLTTFLLVLAQAFVLQQELRKEDQPDSFYRRNLSMGGGQSNRGLNTGESPVV